ncbi:MAG TPA: isopentenyl transferase family protein, partial [Gemmatimonadales bacterium]
MIVGPTAAGKTALAVALAAHFPLTVISADARQVYRDLDIGTAKPEPDVLRRVPHLGVDLIAVGERYSAGRFAADAAGWIEEVRRTGQTPVVVGGTGF